MPLPEWAVNLFIMKIERDPGFQIRRDSAVKRLSVCILMLAVACMLLCVLPTEATAVDARSGSCGETMTWEIDD